MSINELENLVYACDRLANIVDCWCSCDIVDLVDRVEDLIRSKDNEIERLKHILWRNHLSSEDSFEERTDYEL